MTYPHDFQYDARECRQCGLPRVHADPSAECPAALRARVDELERHVGSIIKAQARGFAAGQDDERCATAAYFRRCAVTNREKDEARDDKGSTYHFVLSALLDGLAHAIERGDHRREGE